MTDRLRLDRLLVERGLAESRGQAQRFIMAGQVRVDGQTQHKPATPVAPEAELTVETGPRFVSRGGSKLEAALEAFGLQVDGQVCADVGASTGGFTDCLLQHGAQRVYAVDVGRGQLHWQLRQDPRVVCMEQTNARYLQQLPEPVALASVDVSFISLGMILPNMARWLVDRGQIVALVKPQFEAGREQVGKNGVVRSPEVHRQVLHKVVREAAGLGLGARGLLRSPLTGPRGNVEYLLWLQQDDPGVPIEHLLAGTEIGPAVAPA